MKIGIESNIIKYLLKNVYFINGTAYAGKSTMTAMLAEKHDMILCGENYHSALANKVKTPQSQPAHCYFETMSSWSEFLNRTPKQYFDWINATTEEAIQFEIVELIKISQFKKVIVDTNISVDILHEISDYNHVAIMLSPQSMSVESFFDREDGDKKFILEQIYKCENPQKTLNNFKNCLALFNSNEVFDKFANSGFFTIIRNDDKTNTKDETLESLTKHFNL